MKGPKWVWSPNKHTVVYLFFLFSRLKITSWAQSNYTDRRSCTTSSPTAHQVPANSKWFTNHIRLRGAHKVSDYWLKKIEFIVESVPSIHKSTEWKSIHRARWTHWVSAGKNKLWAFPSPVWVPETACSNMTPVLRLNTISCIFIKSLSWYKKNICLRNNISWNTEGTVARFSKKQTPFAFSAFKCRYQWSISLSTLVMN